MATESVGYICIEPEFDHSASDEKIKVKKFSSLSEVKAKLRDLEREGATKYVILVKKKNYGDEQAFFEKYHVGKKSGKPVKVFSQLMKSRCPIAYDGVPFILISEVVYQCHMGIDQNKRVKARYWSEVHKKGRVPREPKTKKVGCPVVVMVKHIVKFPQFRVQGSDRRAITRAGMQVRSLVKSCQDLRGQYVNEFVMNIPSIDDHKGHPVTGMTAGFRQELDPRVVEVIVDAVRLGVDSVSDILKIVHSFVKDEILHGGKPPKRNRNFFPTKFDLRHYLKRASMSKTDQRDTQKLVSTWQQNIIEDFIYFRQHIVNQDVPHYISPKHYFRKNLMFVDLEKMRQKWREDSEPPLLFCYQSVWQKRLMALHGNTMTFLHPVHEELSSPIPLYFLVVLTNVGYMVVGVILLETPSQQALLEALRIFRNWNPEWKPSTFMVSTSEEDCNVVQAVFKEKGMKLLIHDSHRDKAWQMWQEDESDGIQNKADVVKMMREIAAAPSRENLKNALETLHESDIWKEDAQLRDWFTEIWEKRIKQWTAAYCDKTLTLMMSAGHIKDSLKTVVEATRMLRNGPVHAIVSSLLKHSLPKSYNEYVRLNLDNVIDVEKLRQLPNFPKCQPALPEGKIRSLLPDFIKNSPGVVGEKMFLVAAEASTITNGLIMVNKADGTYSVELQSGKKMDVQFGHDDKLPSCTCVEWQASHLPCIHFFTLVSFVPDVGWDQLSQLYRECLLFRVDYNCRTVTAYTPDRDEATEMEVSDAEEDDNDSDGSDLQGLDSDVDADDGGVISDSPTSSPAPVQAVEELAADPVAPETVTSQSGSIQNVVDNMEENQSDSQNGCIAVSTASSESSNSQDTRQVMAAQPRHTKRTIPTVGPTFSAKAEIPAQIPVNLSTLTEEIRSLMTRKSSTGSLTDGQDLDDSSKQSSGVSSGQAWRHTAVHVNTTITKPVAVTATVTSATLSSTVTKGQVISSAVGSSKACRVAKTVAKLPTSASATSASSTGVTNTPASSFEIPVTKSCDLIPTIQKVVAESTAPTVIMMKKPLENTDVDKTVGGLSVMEIVNVTPSAVTVNYAPLHVTAQMMTTGQNSISIQTDQAEPGTHLQGTPAPVARAESMDTTSAEDVNLNMTVSEGEEPTGKARDLAVTSAPVMTSPNVMTELTPAKDVNVSGPTLSKLSQKLAEKTTSRDSYIHALGLEPCNNSSGSTSSPIVISLNVDSNGKVLTPISVDSTGKIITPVSLDSTGKTLAESKTAVCQRSSGTPVSQNSSGTPVSQTISQTSSSCSTNGTTVSPSTRTIRSVSRRACPQKHGAASGKISGPIIVPECASKVRIVPAVRQNSGVSDPGGSVDNFDLPSVVTTSPAPVTPATPPAKISSTQSEVVTDNSTHTSKLGVPKLVLSKPQARKKVITSASTQTMELPVEETRKAPKGRRQKLIRKCEDTLKHVGDTLKLLKDEGYLTQLDNSLRGLLGEMRELVATGSVNAMNVIKQEFEDEIPLEAQPPAVVALPEVVDLAGPPAKRQRTDVIVEPNTGIQIQEVFVKTDPGCEALESTSNETYIQVEYIDSATEAAVASIKLEDTMSDHAGIMQILDALNVVSQEEVVTFPPQP